MRVREGTRGYEGTREGEGKVRRVRGRYEGTREGESEGKVRGYEGG